MGAHQQLGAAAVETAAALIRFGVDPMRRLETKDPAEAAILDRAVARALELRQNELDYLAHETAMKLARVLGGK